MNTACAVAVAVSTGEHTATSATASSETFDSDGRELPILIVFLEGR